MNSDKKIEYLDEKKIERIKGLRSFNKKYENKELMTFILFIGLTVLGFSSMIASINIGLSSASLAALIVAYKYKCAKKHDNTEKRYNQEIKHLDKLITDEPIKTKEQKDKAVTKLLTTSLSQKDIEQNYINANDLSIMSYIITIIGAITTAISPTYIWLALVGLCTNILAGDNEIRKHKKCEIIEKKLNNLMFDLDINNITYKQIKEKEETNNKVIDKTYQEEKEYIEKPKTYQKIKNNN